ncbi:MAG: glycosyltransferase family 4 protein [Myxococcota bacterium]
MPTQATDIAYLVNQYPKASHTFIRREMAALEAEGVRVHRFALRPAREPLADPADRREVLRTRSVLSARPVALLSAALSTAGAHPGRLLRALRTALRLGWRSERGVLRHLAYAAEAMVLADWIRQCGARHLHAHFGTNSTTVALLTSLLTKIPYSFTVHGPEEFDKADAIGLADKIGHAAFVAAISSFGRSQVYRRCPVPSWNKVHVVRCGIDGAYLDTPPAGIPDAPRLVCVGRLCEQKGQLLLLEAARELLRRGVPFTLSLVGDGEMRPEIERRIAAYGLGARIHVTGWASEARVRSELREARALVLPSFAEGLPVVIMEALALGRPVISTYVAGIPELVLPGRSGWLVPAGSAEDLATAMREALEAPLEALARMGAAGRERVRELHDVARNASQLGALFRQETVETARPDWRVSKSPPTLRAR